MKPDTRFPEPLSLTQVDLLPDPALKPKSLDAWPSVCWFAGLLHFASQFLWHSLCGERCPLTSLLTGEKVDYDVYMPTHVQGPNTEFLKSRSPAFLKKGRIRSNECLQSMVHPEVRPEP